MSWAEVKHIEDKLGKAHKITVTAEDYPSTVITLTDGNDSYAETSDLNGVAVFYVSSGGTWSASCVDEGTTVQLGSTTFDSHNITYESQDGVVDAVFAFHYSENDSNPDSVTYPEGYDNSNWSTDTAYMDFQNNRFHYGAWDPEGPNKKKVNWLFARSCMLKSDGTVDYYLDENNHALKEDGTASDVTNTSYDGNAMMEWGKFDRKIWWKIIPDRDSKGFTFCVANYQVDNNYHCWNHYDCDNTIKDHFYTPKYFGSLSSSKLRSLSGSSMLLGETRQEELDYARANNTTASVHWNTEVYADWLLLQMLTCLISKSMNSQAKFGIGVSSVGISGRINPGSMDTKGMFWGSSSGTLGVKLFGMENIWGNAIRAIQGLMLVNGNICHKLTFNNADGSSATSYNTTGSNYISDGSLSTPLSGVYTSAMTITDKGIFPKATSGSGSTYYSDGVYSASGTNYGLYGGWEGGELTNGIFYFDLGHNLSSTDTGAGAALSYK